nr:putative RNA-directed DNA polymerase, eukaryota, reverse transcriptase zinc-binding domain protein [Tanacetum cinerariifolium]
MLNGVWNSEPNDIKSNFIDFYKDKFSSHDSPNSSPSMLLAHRLSIADWDFLESMVCMDEIKAAVWDCGNQQAPRLNKIVAKILIDRLSKVIDSIISPDKSAFITRWKILDGRLILNETIDWYKKQQKKMMLFKVDFKKAFDSISWRYLDYILDRLGFSIKWRNWIKAGLVSTRTFILINGSPTSEFSLKRVANMFYDVKLGSPGMHLSHLFYADEVIILFEWNLNAMENIIRILNIFYIASGLKINIHKYNVYGVGVSFNEVEIMASYTRCEAGFFPLIYLGLPSSEDSKKLAWVKWSNILASLDKGGLGVGSLKAFNMSLLLK